VELKLVIFDVDGTLIDSQHAIVAAMERAFAGSGRPMPTRAEVLGVVGLSLPEAVARLLPGLAPEAVDAAVARYRSAYFALREDRGSEATAPMFRGARDVIAALHARPDVVLGVATGAARRGLDHVFAAHSLDRYFVTRQTADAHPSKPHPAMIEAALAETGVARDRAVMIGDTTYDIEMARSAGVVPVGVSWGYHAVDALRAAGAALVVDSFEALPGALDDIWRKTA